MISVALKCSVSENVLQHLDDGFDKLTLEVENLLGQMNLNENKALECFLQCTKEFAQERISFRVPPHKRGPTLRRKKSVLEGGKKNAAKSTTNKGMYIKLFGTLFFPCVSTGYFHCIQERI
jgi:hypothetical protein